MSVSIEIAFERPPKEGIRNFPMVYGRIQISVDDEIVTRYTVPEAYDPQPSEFQIYAKDGTPIDMRQFECVGEFLPDNLSSLVEGVETLISGSYERFEEIPIRIGDSAGGREVLVLSHLDGEVARLAFQSRRDRDESTEWPYPATGAAVGYAVNPTELCDELRRCHEEYLSYVETGFRALEDRPQDGELDEFREDIEATIGTLRALAKS